MNLELLKQAVDAGFFQMEEVKQELLNRIFGAPVTITAKINQEISSPQPELKRVYRVRNIADAFVQAVHLKGRPIGTSEIKDILRELGYTYAYSTIIQGACNFPENHVDPLGRKVVRTRNNGNFGHYVFKPA